MTRPGIEAGPNVTGTRRRTGTSTEAGALERPAATFECNECNELLEGAREALLVARRLAIVADSAILNGDLGRARAALGDLQVAAARTTHAIGVPRQRLGSDAPTSG